MATRKSVIAVIDDDPDLLLALDDMLTSSDLMTELYSSAEQFLAAVRLTEARCLVVDINLGDITGIELARHLRADGFKFPIIFMSGNMNETVLQQAAELSAADFLQKPFSARRLLDAVKKTLALRALNGA